MTYFALGVLTTLVTAWLGYHIISIVEARIKEKEQWRRVLSHPSPSEAYWRKHIQETQPTLEDEGSITIRPPSPTPGEQ